MEKRTLVEGVPIEKLSHLSVDARVEPGLSSHQRQTHQRGTEKQGETYAWEVP